MAPSPPMAHTAGFAYGTASMHTVSAATSSLPNPWSFTRERCLATGELTAKRV